MRSHAARPRLVVDNKSSSVNGISRSRAKRSNGKCHLPGMPNAGQFRIVDSGMPRPTASSFEPPKRRMIAGLSTDTIAKDYPFYGPSASPFSGFVKFGARKTDGRNNLPMQKQKRIRTPVLGAPVDEAVLKEQMVRNLKDVRKAFQYDVPQMAEALGLPLSTYKNHEGGVSFIPHDIIMTLINLGASADFLYLGVGSPLRIKKTTTRQPSVDILLHETRK